ncbi:MAG: DUF2780 domain-containing protein [Methylococcaceae bacterium]
MNKPINAVALGMVSAFLFGCAGNSPQGEDILTNTASSGKSAGMASKVGQLSLTDNLVNQLGVSETQAQGGAGAIMKYAKNRLSPSEFSGVSAAVPGMDGLLGAVPSSSGIGGKALSAATGSTGGLGGTAELASTFQDLDLSPDMVGKFVPVISNYVKTAGGDSTAAILQSALGGL